MAAPGPVVCLQERQGLPHSVSAQMMMAILMVRAADRAMGPTSLPALTCLLHSLILPSLYRNLPLPYCSLPGFRVFW